ncbi:hypothetical protein [Fulvimonas soli]|jgi:hypothetical protein|uniref:Transmembrane protein n=1 Tax=Fulvimonas soli TaxID=155197 RepID=A0A316I047_9GAMM|nr:hypothetical protein [Fulvimonas soli]PWK85833.1 hypothetical protein C7456_108129 [Fulvimonas soli]TNY27261.1 hypothetical protein BV497_04580 [Fulvimonas soli]
MHYDQSWMGYGWVGGVQAGLITAVAAAALYLLFQWLFRRRRGHAAAIGWSYLLSLALTASGDLWDMFYFNYARLQSLQLLKAKLAEVHDPDGIATRVLCELLGAVVGVFVAWLLAGRPPRASA